MASTTLNATGGVDTRSTPITVANSSANVAYGLINDSDAAVNVHVAVDTGVTFTWQDYTNHGHGSGAPVMSSTGNTTFVKMPKKSYVVLLVSNSEATGTQGIDISTQTQSAHGTMSQDGESLYIVAL